MAKSKRFIETTVGRFVFGALALLGLCPPELLNKSLQQSSKNLDETDETEFTPFPGEPDDQVFVNPTRPNEPDGCVLLYRKEGVLVYVNERIPIDMITEISITNISIPYNPAAYHILLVLSNGQVVHIPAGQDREWAYEAMKQLRGAIFLTDSCK